MPRTQIICAQHGGLLPKDVRDELIAAFNMGHGEHSGRFNAALHVAKQHWRPPPPEKDEDG